MTMTRRRSIGAVRLVVALLLAATVFGVLTSLNSDPCDQGWTSLRPALLILPLLLFGSLVVLGAMTSDQKREPWIAFGLAGVLFLTYLPYVLAVILWDIGC
jgi:drug/metabolite transporter (DMT)-like permease